jgi:hypothetical protein
MANPIKVSGITVTPRAYSEKRRKELEAVNKEIQEWVDAHPDFTIGQVPIEMKAKWWEAKAGILWEGEYAEGFFASDEFESSILQETEDFFVLRRLYL